MSFQGRIELAREKVLQAEHDLDAYVRGPKYRLEQHKQLAEAVKKAREELLLQLAELWPERS